MFRYNSDVLAFGKIDGELYLSIFATKNTLQFKIYVEALNSPLVELGMTLKPILWLECDELSSIVDGCTLLFI